MAMEFLGHPVVRTPHFHYWGPGFIPGQGTKIQKAAWCSTARKKKEIL